MSEPIAIDTTLDYQRESFQKLQIIGKAVIAYWLIEGISEFILTTLRNPSFFIRFQQVFWGHYLYYASVFGYPIVDLCFGLRGISRQFTWRCLKQWCWAELFLAGITGTERVFLHTASRNALTPLGTVTDRPETMAVAIFWGALTFAAYCAQPGVILWLMDEFKLVEHEEGVATAQSVATSNEDATESTTGTSNL